MSFGPTCSSTLRITNIEIQPVNTIDVYRTWDYWKGYTYEYLFPSDFYLYQVESVGANQVWSGNDRETIFFQDAGSINLKITINAVPQNDVWSYTNWSIFISDYLPNFQKTITIPNIFIQSSQAFELQQAQTAWQQQMVNLQQQQQAQEKQWEEQQQINGDMNLGLTFFVLFFAAIDVAVVVIDRSIDEERKKDYERMLSTKNNDIDVVD